MGSSHVRMLIGASWWIVLVHVGTVVQMAGESCVAGVIHLGDVVCMGDTSMVLSA